MEDVILNEMRYFHEVLEKSKEEPMNIWTTLKQSVSNIATHIAFGRRFDYNDDQLANLQVEEFFAAFFKTTPIPFIRVSFISFH